jgi:hypothetical protein
MQSPPNSGATWITFPLSSNYEQHRRFRGIAYGEEFQRVSKDGLDASVRSLGEWNKGVQAIAATVADYSKEAFEDGTRAFEQLVGVKSVEQAWEIQSQYAKSGAGVPLCSFVL